jgi:hypothetical protein
MTYSMTFVLQARVRAKNEMVRALLSIITFIWATEMSAQLPTATIHGTVKDISGAVMPDAALTAVNLDTRLVRTTNSNGEGSYRFAGLPVGNYEIRAERYGFRPRVFEGISLSVSEEAVINFTLELGSIDQSVQVIAEGSLGDSSSDALGGLVNESRIAELPLNGRNYIDLTLIQAGIAQSVNKSPAHTGVGTLFSSNGATIYSNNYTLDGANMANFFGGSTSSGSGATLGLDGIQEYRVLTNSFTAEYGMNMGSQMLIVSKSGNNKFHGSLFDYLRNEILDARNYFDYTTLATPGRLPPFKRNNFGASFGGPMEKDKMFFFGVYEGLRESKGLTNIVTTISPEDRVEGGVVSKIAPAIKPFLAYFPNPNLPLSQFTYPFTQPMRSDYGQIRADHNFSEGHNLFVRYTI